MLRLWRGKHVPTRVYYSEDGGLHNPALSRALPLEDQPRGRALRHGELVAADREQANSDLVGQGAGGPRLEKIACHLATADLKTRRLVEAESKGEV